MDKKLFEAAQSVLPRAYVKYSNFRVGAALKLKDGTIITGVNIENASFGLTNCAERTAIYTAYAQGYKKEDIEAILITTEQDHLVSPCGACRQVMRELIPLDAPVYLSDKFGNTTTIKNEELLPLGFTEADL
ncbi:cytidine deaminase [Liberiplasma polymorphum]|uniref:cytidine deaminase n=1 Tax=Liberiplasma polymorphum TaxID=3374570 RepID=UPI003773AB68